MEEKGDPTKGDPSAPHTQFPPPALCSKCRKTAGQGGDEGGEWDEDVAYAFLLSYYSGEQPLDAAPSAGLRSRRSSWADAGLVVLAVAGCVYAVLRRSGNYALRRVHSRTL